MHIIEPQWTQTAENQAVDRVHRLGQTQDVIAKSYIVENSIEDVRSDVSREPQEAKASPACLGGPR